MSKKRKIYSKEFKLETIELAKNSTKTDTQLEQDLGLSRGCLYNWRKQVEQAGEQAFPGKGNLKAEDEYTCGLERELALVRQERDILKKALAIFSQDQKS